MKSAHMYEATVLDSVDINNVHVRRWFRKMGGSRSQPLYDIDYII